MGRRASRQRAATLLLALLAVAACSRTPAAVPAPVIEERFVASGYLGAVATADERASFAGLRMLEAGGNAVDAFAAASFAVSVTRPQSTGIGGGGFAVLYLQTAGQETRELAVDFRERAPERATRDMCAAPGVAEDACRFGPLSVATPGLVAGVLDIHARYGRLPRAQVVAPAIELADSGFEVYENLATSIEQTAPLLGRYAESARIFLPGGAAPKPGEYLRQPDLGETLRRIASDGGRDFYRGRTASAIAAEMQRLGGLLTQRDLASYRVIDRAALVGRYRGYDVVTMPPPSSGVLLIEMMNMLSVAGPAATLPPGADRYHLLAEVMRRAYEDRARYLGDPDFFPVPVSQLASREYAAQRLSDYDPARASARPPSPAADIKVTSTTHLSVLDAEGNAVAATETINYTFGSGITVPGTGVVLNNEMDDFAARPGVPNLYGLVGSDANAIAPRKTPLSSMSPTILVRSDGQPVLLAGSPGGSFIITATLQTILNVVDLRSQLPQAVAQPRIHHQAIPTVLLYEPRAMNAEVAAELRARGHALKEIPEMGNVQVVAQTTGGEKIGVSDPRAEGRPAAY
jgi:gamma-glutamyltranspeptidase/glutathione hydrolase